MTRQSILNMDLTDRIREIRKEEGRQGAVDSFGRPLPADPLPAVICQDKGHDIGLTGRCTRCGINPEWYGAGWTADALWAKIDAERARLQKFFDEKFPA